MTELMVWIFVGEAALLALCVAVAATWRARRRRRRNFAAIEGLLDRIAEQEPDRIAQQTRFLQSACHAPAAAAAQAAREMSAAEREFIGTLLTPLLGADTDYPKGLDERLHLFADRQAGIIARLAQRKSEAGDAAPAPTPDPELTGYDSGRRHEESGWPEPAPAAPGIPAAAEPMHEAVMEGILPPLPDANDTPGSFQTPDESDVAWATPLDAEEEGAPVAGERHPTGNSKPRGKDQEDAGSSEDTGDPT